MNYQLMFQTIALVCLIPSVFLGFVLIMLIAVEESVPRYVKVLWLVLFIITLITGALAAGLS